VPTLRSPESLKTADGTVWAYSPLEHSMMRLSVGHGPWPPSVTIQNQLAIMDSNGPWLAISGLEQATVFGPNGQVHRFAFLSTPVSALCVTHDGSVIVGNDGSLARLA